MCSRSSDVFILLWLVLTYSVLLSVATFSKGDPKQSEKFDILKTLHKEICVIILLNLKRAKDFVWHKSSGINRGTKILIHMTTDNLNIFYVSEDIVNKISVQIKIRRKCLQ